MNDVFVSISHPDSDDVVGMFLRLGDQPLPRIGEEMDFEGLRFRVADVAHSISPNADDHGIALSLEATNMKNLRKMYEILDSHYGGDTEGDPTASVYRIELN